MKIFNVLAISTLIGLSVAVNYAAQAGTLGPCPNRGDRCYLEMNGKFSYQLDEEPYFPGGWKEAARWCATKGGQYINSISGPDYCAFKN